jgi:hypothetical protein
MSQALSIAAFATSLLSAAAFYAGSVNCRWSWPRWRHGTVMGWVLAAVSLAAWIAALGVGAGVSVMMGTWSLGAIALPYLALRSGPVTKERR